MSLALTTKSERHAKKGNIVRMVAMLRFYLKGKEILNVDLDARKLQIFHKSLPPPKKKTNKRPALNNRENVLLHVNAKLPYRRITCYKRFIPFTFTPADLLPFSIREKRATRSFFTDENQVFIGTFFTSKAV